MTGKAQTRGDDAADHVPQPQRNEGGAPKKEKQDAPNYDDKAKGRDAMNVENVSSSNDEGAA